MTVIGGAPATGERTPGPSPILSPILLADPAVRRTRAASRRVRDALAARWR
ncbi:hypothetical protein [Streptosporangium vulgare]|uniref:Uncharacterized protein n=1 Tax=Streptosporangium vulgare TaxID=46190 RepID=A0ABV5TJ29_9ACTN